MNEAIYLPEQLKRNFSPFLQLWPAKYYIILFLLFLITIAVAKNLRNDIQGKKSIKGFISYFSSIDKKEKTKKSIESIRVGKILVGQKK